MDEENSKPDGLFFFEKAIIKQFKNLIENGSILMKFRKSYFLLQAHLIQEK